MTTKAHLRDEAEAKVAEQAKEIAALRAALQPFAAMNCGHTEPSPSCSYCAARAALGLSK